MRFTNAELSLMKGIFAGNDELLYAVRKSMLQLELNLGESTVLGGLTEEAHKLLKKVFLPDLDGDSPLFQMTDMILGLGADIKSLSPDGAWSFIKAKELEIDYLAQQLEILRGRGESKISLEEMGDLSGAKTTRESTYIKLIARNFLLSFIDSNCQQIKVLAGLKEESVEETLKKLAQNSNK
jgi:hypothetical protein